MQELTPWRQEPEETPAEMLRLWRAAAMRHRTLMIAVFLAVFSGAAAAALLLPPHYLATTKILVKRERVDTMVTPDAAGVAPQMPGLVTEMEVNSEVELIRSRDLLQQVAGACGLDGGTPRFPWRRWLHLPEEPVTPDAALAAGVSGLQKALKVEALPKTSLISVTYESADPHQAARVLNTLFALYLEKHVAVHQPTGALEFFQNQRREYERGLKAAEAQLMDFGSNRGVVSPDQQKVSALQKSADLEADWRQTQAAIAQAEQRIQSLEAEGSGMPARMTAQVRKSDNPQLMGQLKSTLLNLELRRTELLRKYEPTYTLVREVDTQIAQTRAGIEDAEKAQLREETTDRNPIYEWVGSELAKARSDLAGLRARSLVMGRNLRLYGQQARTMDQQEILRQNLVRDFKAQEAGYFLYQRKEEEARISDALNRSRIVNVALVETASLPRVPTRSRAMMLALGFLAGLLVSVGAAAAAEYLNPPIREPATLFELLGVPVLASISGVDLKALPQADKIRERN